MMEQLDYHSPHSPQLTRTALNCFRESHETFRDVYVNHTRRPKILSELSEKLRLRGIVLHAIVVEGKSPNTFIVRYPDSCMSKGGNLKKNGPQQFRHDNPGMLCLKPIEIAAMMEMLLHVQRHPDVAADVSDQDVYREHELHRTIDGVDCKTRLDLWRPGENPIDYKFTGDITLPGFRRSAKRFAYWLQDTHYSQVALSEHLKFRCVEVIPPYRVHDYWFPIETRGMSFDKHGLLLAELKECRETGDWSDVWPNEVELKPWDILETQDQELIGAEVYE